MVLYSVYLNVQYCLIFQKDIFNRHYTYVWAYLHVNKCTYMCIYIHTNTKQRVSNILLRMVNMPGKYLDGVEEAVISTAIELYKAEANRNLIIQNTSF